MKVIKTSFFLFLAIVCFHANAQTYLVKDSNSHTSHNDYVASRFGIKSDGRTLNTASIQKAVDFINEKGGGRLVFYVGRYLTGSIQLKSNVIVQLEEGAVLVSSQSIYDYSYNNGTIPALVSGVNIKNSGITGKGVIEGNGVSIIKNIKDQVAKGFIDQHTVYAPTLVSFDSCENVLLSVQNYMDVAADAIKMQNSSNITIDSAAIKTISASGFESAGIVLSNCKNILISNCFLDTNAPYISILGKVENLQCINVVTVNGQLLKAGDKGIISSSKKLIQL